MASSSDATRSSSSEGGISEVAVMKKGPWTAAEDAMLIEYVNRNGEGNWNAVQRNSGLRRCGKSCRLRWANHLRPNLKKGAFTAEEERLILELHAKYGNKWARMASQMSGRTDNEIKNYWNTRMKRHQRAGLATYPSDIQSGELHQSHRQHRLPRQRKHHHHHHHHQARMLYFQNQRTISFNPTTSQPQPFIFTTTQQTQIPSHQFNFFTEHCNADPSQSYQPSVASRPLFDPIPPQPLQLMKQESSEFGFVHLLSSGISSASGMLDDVLNSAQFRSQGNANMKDDDDEQSDLKKLKNAPAGDEDNSSSGLTSIGMRMEEPVVEINPLDDELTSLLDSFPSASPTPQWYRRGTTMINGSSSDARGGVVLDLTTTTATTNQLPSAGGKSIY